AGSCATTMNTRPPTVPGARPSPSRSRAAPSAIRKGRRSMTVRCFVDASVLLQARDPRDPLKQARATEWLDRLWQQRSGRTSFQVLAEFYVLATRKLSPRVPEDLAWDEVTRYLAWAPQETNEPLLR